MYHKCCVDNCANVRPRVKMHKLPKSETGLYKWLQCINSDRLFNLSIQELRNVFVCHKHFERRFVKDNNRILLEGYPSLFSEEEIQSGVPSVTQEAQVLANVKFDHCYNRRKHEDHTYIKARPSIPIGSAPKQPQVPQKNQNLPEQPSVSGLSLEQPQVVEVKQMPQQQPTLSGSTPKQPQVPQKTQNLPEQPILSGSSLRQPPVPTPTTGFKQQLPATAGPSRVLREIQNLPPADALSDHSLVQSPVFRQKQDLPQVSELSTVSGITTDAGTRKRKRRRRMMRKTADLSPCCRDIYFEYKKSVKQLDFMRRAKRAMKFSKTQAFENLTSNVNPLAKQLMWMQIAQSGKKLKGRRFTDDEKMISLAIFKQSPKAYKFLKKIFILPSRNTLLKMSSRLNVQPGINNQIFDAIKDQVQYWSENRKYCSIIFDEMSLEPGLEPDKSQDHINGFVHLNVRKNDIADHALAFMLRGAVHKWQQPVAFYFCEGATKKDDLKVILKNMINAVVDTGLLPLAVISDQGQSFQSALKALMEDTRRDQIKAGKPIDDVITIKGHDLNVLFDAPHLIKGIRNNFLNKEMKFENKICKWSDIVDVYNTDCGHAQTRLLHKLNDTHVIPEKIMKMKVKNCTQVLSQTVAAALSYTSQFSHYADGREISGTLENTAEAVSFFDKLFDSVNGASLSGKVVRGKLLKKAVTNTSPHLEFWRDAIKKLEKMKFIDEKRGEVSVPSIKNWVVTLKSYIRLWQFFEKKNIKIMRPRYFNSDPIENFFGQVRAYNFRNNDPTCHNFISTFKALLITRFIKFHSAGFNCEEDVGAQLINIKKIFEHQHTNDVENTNAPHNSPESSETNEQQNIREQARRERIGVHARAYTTGWLVRKINKKINCDACMADLTTEEGPIHRWISQREYQWLKNKNLTYPAEHAVRSFSEIVKESNKYLDRKPHFNSITQKIKDHILSKYSFDYLKCALHRRIVLEYFVNLTIKFAVHNWCKTINKILNGTDTSRLGKSGLPLMQRKALEKYTKKLKNKKK